MNKSYYPSKICRPILPNILFRQRLFTKIDALRKQNVVWVSGPGGAGKTTLLNSYAAARNLPCLWYHLDSSDEDLATFFHYLAMAGKKATALHKGEYPVLTPEYLFGIEEFSRNFFSEIFQHLEPDSLLVFDNCQDVGDSAEIFKAILAGLTRMPQGMNIVFISRNEPVATFSRLRANRGMSLLNWSDLRLTYEEFSQIAEEQHIAYSKNQLRDLYELIDGWAAGIALMATPYDRLVKSPKIQLRTQSIQNIFEYFAEEVLGQLDSNSCEFLIKSSLLPYLDKELLECIGDSSQVLTLLNQLYLSNIYITQLSNSPPVYQYHQLFQEFLRDQCSKILSGEEIAKFRSSAALQLIAKSQILEAAQLLIAAEDWMNLGLLIISQATTLFQNGQFQTLAYWLRNIPEPAIKNEPWLLYWSGMCLMLENPEAGRKHFKQSLNGFKERKDATGIYLAASGLGDCLAYEFNSFVEYDQWIEQLTALHAAYPEFPSREIEARVTVSMLSGLTLRKPSHSEFPSWRQRAHSLLQSKDGIQGELKLQLLMPLIMNRLFSGDLIEAKHLIGSYQRLAEAKGMPALALLTLKNFEGHYRWKNGDFVECHAVVKEALKFADESGIHVLSLMLLINGASGALCAADLTLADFYLDKIEPALGRAGAYVTLTFHLVKIWKHLLAEETAKALFHAEHAQSYADQAGNPESTAYAHYGFALALHGAGRYDEAALQLDFSKSLGTEAKARHMIFACLLAQAEFAFTSDDKIAACKYLREGLAIGRANAYTNLYGWRPKVMSKLCQLALREGIETRYTQELIRRRRLLPDNPPIFLLKWPWKLRIFTFGNFQILGDDKPLRANIKSQQKPLALLKSLISFGAIGVSQSTLEDALWPDSDGDMQLQIFNTTLHRLRKLLGDKDLLILGGGELTLNNKLCWLDLWSFKRHAEKALQGVKDGALNPQHNKSAERITELYQGPFLAAEQESWAIPMREKLYNTMVLTIERLGQYYFQNSQWEQAIEWYRRGIHIDPQVELFYHQLMLCYLIQDRKAEALQIYSQCHTVLKATMGIRPSQSMQELHKKVNGTTT